MTKSNKIEVEGVVVEILPGRSCKVRITDKDYQSQLVQGYFAGKMRMNFIRVIPGDRVRIEIDPYNIQLGRITFRYK